MENDWEQKSSNPLSIKYLTDQASVSRLPLAKPFSKTVKSKRCECIQVTLISTIKEWEVFLASNDVSNPGPLLLGWIHPSRVVGTGVEDDHRARGEGLEVSQHALNVQAVGLGVIVPVFGHVLETSVLEYEAVVAPCGVTVVGVGEASDSVEELSSNPQGSGAA